MYVFRNAVSYVATGGRVKARIVLRLNNPS